mgnify:CR=1 FL=1
MLCLPAVCKLAYWVLHLSMHPVRAFKTNWFAKAARKRGITDQELCSAIEEVIAGQADDLGGGVFKKRLNKNMDRSIVLAKGGRNWFFVFLFQKADRENIADGELTTFKALATTYQHMREPVLSALLVSKELVEICNQ